MEDADDMGQGDGRSQGISKMTDITIVPPIFMAALKSASSETKKSVRTLMGATLGIEVLSQCGQCTLNLYQFQTLLSKMNHENGSVVGQLTREEHNRLTKPQTLTIDEPAGG